jgi:hypothetical protein
MVALGLFSSLSVQGSKSVRAILSVAHVTQHGGETRETRIYVMRDHSYYLEVIDQAQPSPQPSCKQFLGVLSEQGFQRIALFMDSTGSHPLRNSSGTVGHQDGNFWYISIPRETGTQFLALSAEDKNTPDVIRHLIAWFEETEKLKPSESINLRDHQCSVFSDKTAEIWRR